MNFERVRWLGQLWLCLALLGGVTDPSSVLGESALDGFGKVAGASLSRSGRRHALELKQGQTDFQVNFLARGPDYSVFLTGCEAVLALRSPGGEAALVQMRLVGARSAPGFDIADELPGA